MAVRFPQTSNHGHFQTNGSPFFFFAFWKKYDVYSYKRKAPGKHTVHSIDIDPPWKICPKSHQFNNLFFVDMFSLSLMRNPPSGIFFEWEHNKTRRCRPTQKHDDYKDGGCCCRSYTIAREVFWAINEQGNDGYVCEHDLRATSDRTPTLPSFHNTNFKPQKIYTVGLSTTNLHMHNSRESSAGPIAIISFLTSLDYDNN